MLTALAGGAVLALSSERVMSVMRHVVVRLRQRRADAEEARFLAAVAAELRAGAVLRRALTEAARRAPSLDLAHACRLANAGAPMPRIARELRRALGVNGRRVAAAVELSAITGARAADAFLTLAQRAAHVTVLVRERRALTAQARLSALVVGGAPLIFGIGLLASGRGAVLVGAGPAGIVTLAVGLTLELSGLVVVAVMVRRAV